MSTTSKRHQDSGQSGTEPTPPVTPAARSARLGWWFYLGHLATVWGIALSNALLGLTLLWCALPAQYARWRTTWHPRRLWRAAWPLLLPLGLYTVFLFVSVLASMDPALSRGHLREIFALSTLILTLLLVRDTAAARRVVDVLIGTAVVVALYGIAQSCTGGYGSLHHRISGPFSHYQTFAGVLLVGDLLLFARMVTGDGWRRRRHWVALALINWTLFATLTRGSWVALLIAVTVYAVLRARRSRWAYAVYLAAVVLFLTLAPDSWRARMRSIGDLQDASNYDRLCMVEAGLFMIAERPLFGLGPGMVEELYPIYRHPTAPRFTVPHLHNAFLELAAERGLLSLGAYLWLMAAAFVPALVGYRGEGGPHGHRADLYLGTMLVLLGFNLAGLFEDNWRDTEIQRLILFVLALPCCLRREALAGSADETDGPH